MENVKFGKLSLIYPIPSVLMGTVANDKNYLIEEN